MFFDAVVSVFRTNIIIVVVVKLIYIVQIRAVSHSALYYDLCSYE